MQRNRFWNQNGKQQGGYRHSDVTDSATTPTNLVENTKDQLSTEEKAIHKRWMRDAVQIQDQN